jgi:hypothetical protein
MAAISALPAPSPVSKGSECQIEPEIEVGNQQDVRHFYYIILPELKKVDFFLIIHVH